MPEPFGRINRAWPRRSKAFSGARRKIAWLAAHHRCDVLVLGAWGCGVFRNDPDMVAGIFRELLGPDGRYWGRFQKVSTVGLRQD